jgi:hypothetical protein
VLNRSVLFWRLKTAELPAPAIATPVPLCVMTMSAMIACAVSAGNRWH